MRIEGAEEVITMVERQRLVNQLIVALLALCTILTMVTAPALSDTVTRYQILASDIEVGDPVFSTYPTAGTCFLMKVPATNNGNTEADEIVFNLTVEEPFSFDGDSGVKTISRLGSGVWGWVDYNLCVDSVAPEGEYALDITHTYEELGSDSYVLGNITLPVGGVPRFDLTVEPTTADLKLETMTFTLENIGTGIAKDIELLLATDGTPLVLEGMNIINIKSIEAGASQAFEFKVQVTELTPFNLPVTITYSSSLGETTTQSIKVGISARQKISTEGLEIAEVAIEPEFVFPGQRFTVKFSVENVGLYDARLVKVVMGKVETNDIVTEVFVPSGQGNTVHLGTIPPEGSKNVTFTMLTSGNANSGSYSVPITLLFVDFEDNDREIDRNIGVAVRSKSTLTPTEVTTVPATVTAGSSFTLTLGVSNGGPAKATSLKVRFRKNDNFQPVGKDTVFIGTLDVDLADSAEFAVMVSPKASGSVRLPVFFEYVDDYGNTIREIVEASITVQGISPEDLAAMGDKGAGKRTTINNGAAAGISIISPEKNALVTTKPVNMALGAVGLLVVVYILGKLIEPKRSEKHSALMRTFSTLVANRMALAVVVLIAGGIWLYGERATLQEEVTISQLISANAEVKKQLSKVPDITSWRIMAMEKGSLDQKVDAGKLQFITTYVVTLEPDMASDKRVKAEVDTRMGSVTSMDLCTVAGGKEDCKILYEAKDEETDMMKKLAQAYGKGGGRMRVPRK